MEYESQYPWISKLCLKRLRGKGLLPDHRKQSVVERVSTRVVVVVVVVVAQPDCLPMLVRVSQA